MYWSLTKIFWMLKLLKSMHEKKRLKYKYSGPGRIQTDSDANTNKKCPAWALVEKISIEGKKKEMSVSIAILLSGSDISFYFSSIYFQIYRLTPYNLFLLSFIFKRPFTCFCRLKSISYLFCHRSARIYRAVNTGIYLYRSLNMNYYPRLAVLLNRWKTELLWKHLIFACDWKLLLLSNNRSHTEWTAYKRCTSISRQ